MLKEAMEFFPHSVGNRGTDVESRGVGRHATHGFDKKSQKTPRTEITLAKKIRDEYYQSRQRMNTMTHEEVLQKYIVFFVMYGLCKNVFLKKKLGI